MDETKANALVRREAQLGQVGLRKLVASLARCRETAVVQATTVDDVGFRRRRDGGLGMIQAARVRLSKDGKVKRGWLTPLKPSGDKRPSVITSESSW